MPALTVAKSSKSKSSSIHLPDIIFDMPFPLRSHPNAKSLGTPSDKWLDDGCPELSPKKRAKIYALKGYILTSYCYPTCNDYKFRVINDFIGYFFHLDNISDGMMTNETKPLADVVMNALWHPESYRPSKQSHPLSGEEMSAGKLARDFWVRCTRDAGPRFQARFKEHFQLYLESMNRQSSERADGVILDLDSYIDIRREGSGCRILYDLLEYALGIDLPDAVADHPIVKALNQASNDIVTWMNDILSFNVEQAAGETHNMVIILMKHNDMALQDAVDYVGYLCEQLLHNFLENKSKLPSFGPELDRDVQAYVQGLEDWIVGAVMFQFESERYFGEEGKQAWETRSVTLLPKKA